jgi:hypothetical protein
VDVPDLLVRGRDAVHVLVCAAGQRARRRSVRRETAEALRSAVQLGSIKWASIHGGRIKIESKDDAQAGLPSPDRADAIAIALLPGRMPHQ